LVLASLRLALVLFAPRVPGLRRVPGPLIALMLVTALQAVLQLPGVATLGSAFGGIPPGLPHWQWPQFSMSQMLALTGPAVTIALLGGIESLLSASVADGMSGTRHDSNQELIGQGIANLIVPFFGGFAATGAIARTATNIRNGATSPLAGIAHAITLVAVLLLLAPLAASIPLATLAAILFVVAWNMSEPHRFVHLLRASPPADKFILLVTFVLTIFTDLVIAVNVGVGLSILQFLRRMAASAEAQPANELALRDELVAVGCAPLPANTVVYEMSGPLFFAAVDNFERALLHTHTEPACLVLRLRQVPFIDMTGLQALTAVVQSLQRRGVQVVLCEANERVLAKLQRAGVLALPELRYAPDLLRALSTVAP
jgi:SulP family sulfate permease